MTAIQKPWISSRPTLAAIPSLWVLRALVWSRHSDQASLF
jgi:hypothetical protein